MITKWYVAEPNSSSALALRTRFAAPCFLTDLHRLELVTCWQLMVFRKQISASAASQALGDFEADIGAGLWIAAELSATALSAEALRLSLAYAATLGTRTLDILHVASARVLGQRPFVTGDRRQAALAQAAGLQVARL